MISLRSRIEDEVKNYINGNYTFDEIVEALVNISESYGEKMCKEQKKIDLTLCFKELDTIYHDEIETAIKSSPLATDK